MVKDWMLFPSYIQHCTGILDMVIKARKEIRHPKVNYIPQKDTLKPQIPRPVNVTSFGDEVFADVIKVQSYELG